MFSLFFFCSTVDFCKHINGSSVVVVGLVVQLFATPHEPGSNPVIGNFYALKKEKRKRQEKKKRQQLENESLGNVHFE